MGSQPAVARGLTNTAPRPSSPGGSGNNSDVGDVEGAAAAAATAGSQSPSRGDPSGGGSSAEGSVAGNSIASDSIAGLSAGNGGGTLSGVAAEAAVSHSVLRVIELEVRGDSEAENDAESARALLPEPAVPAPDPKVVAIPPEKVRQHVRRPMPRAQRHPLRALEILPVQPETTSPNSSRPGSRNAAKARRESSKPKAEQQQQQTGKEKGVVGGDDMLGAGVPSGALEGNPYRWMVSSCIYG